MVFLNIVKCKLGMKIYLIFVVPSIMLYSSETCRVKPLRRIKTQLLHLVGLISLLRKFMFKAKDLTLWH